MGWWEMPGGREWKEEQFGLNSKSLTTCLFCFPFPSVCPHPISFLLAPLLCLFLSVRLSSSLLPSRSGPAFAFSTSFPFPPLASHGRNRPLLSVQSNLQVPPQPPPPSFPPPPPSLLGQGGPPSPLPPSLSLRGGSGREGGPDQHVAPGAVSGGAGELSGEGPCGSTPQAAAWSLAASSGRSAPVGEHSLRASAQRAARAQQLEILGRRAVPGRALRHAPWAPAAFSRPRPRLVARRAQRHDPAARLPAEPARGAAGHHAARVVHRQPGAAATYVQNRARTACTSTSTCPTENPVGAGTRPGPRWTQPHKCPRRPSGTGLRGGLGLRGGHEGRCIPAELPG